jgi:soluble lytic murein transglycosylase
MPARLVFGPSAAAALALLVSFALLSCRGSSEPIPDRMEGDIEESVSRIDTDDMPVQAEAFLATDRPWRAARVMRRYLELVDDAPAEHRVLAARAEAGYGGWPAVRSLLADIPNLDAYYNGVGLYLLARAHDEHGDAPAAVTHYRDFLALSPPAGEMERERGAAQLRLALALIRTGDHQRASGEMQAARQLLGDAASWLDVLRADALAQTGDQDAVRQQVAGFGTGYRGLRGWRARIAAARQAGDLAQARTLANQAREWARTDATRAEFFVAAASAAIDLGDVAAGRAALRSAIGLGAATQAARDAADMLRAGDMTPDDHLAVARVYRALGMHEESLEGYRNWLGAGSGTAGVRSRVIMEYANALFYAEHYDQVQDALRPIASQQDARMLEARALAHLGETDAAERIYLALDGQTGNGLALYLAADIRHAAGHNDRARELYDRVISRYAGSSYMGLSMMRIAGIVLPERRLCRRGPPSGTTTASSTPAAPTRSSRSTGVPARTRRWATRRRGTSTGRSASGSATGTTRCWRASGWASRSGRCPWAPSRREPGGLAPRGRVDAGGGPPPRRRLPDEASAEADRVVSPRAGPGDALRAGGGPRRAGVQPAGHPDRARAPAGGAEPPADADPLSLPVPHPHPGGGARPRARPVRHGRPHPPGVHVRGADQSHVGARGLMQIMPTTGRRLAEAAGIEPYDPEVLYHPEINVHLGTRYVAQHWENYDGALPSSSRPTTRGRTGWSGGASTRSTATTSCSPSASRSARRATT